MSVNSGTTNGIPVYREGERAERCQPALDEAADILKVECCYRISDCPLPAAASGPAALHRGTLDNPPCRPAAGRSDAEEPRPSRAPDISNPLQIPLLYKDIAQMSNADAPTSEPANSTPVQ